MRKEIWGPSHARLADRQYYFLCAVIILAFVRATKMLIYCMFWQSYLELRQRLENVLASLKFNLDKL